DFQSTIPPYPSIGIGAVELSLYEMMQGYSIFPGRGFSAKPMYITRIEDRNGNVLANFVPVRKEVISDVTAYSVIKMMQGVMSNGTGVGIWGYDMPAGLEIAGKTGTTNDNSDAWFMGYTPQLLAGVWVGADDRFVRFKKESKNGEGGRAAMPIWAYFMRKAAADPACGIDTKMTFNRPEDINTDIQIDYSNGNVPIMSGESETGGGVVETGYDAGNTEVIGAESDTSLLGVRPKPSTSAGDQPPAKPADNKTDTKSPANLPPKPPVPAPKKTGGNG
ncbi:MAG: penicillin-binding protein, partial [Chitinophagaceae bacterium]|nr:penicillin-binding protein [Chitinophagaceae bacterium]